MPSRRSPSLLSCSLRPIAALLAGSVTMLNAEAEIWPAPEQDVHALLTHRIRDEQRGVGIAVATVAEDGRIRFVCAGGLTPDGPPVDEHTIFEVGSVTKVFTALLLALAVQRGEMQLSDPADKYLPPEMKLPARHDRQITLLDLATQRSGLPRLPDNLAGGNPDDPYADYTDHQLATFLAGYTLPRDVGSQYEYSNLGFGVLGHALTHVAGVDYDTLVRKEICTPLAMRDTAATLTGDLSKRLAKPYDEALVPAHEWHLPTFAGAGALHSSAADLARFVAANLGFIDYAGRPAMLAMQKPQADTTQPGTEIGLAWNLKHADGCSLVYHGGATGGYRAFVGLDVAHRHGVVVLANSGNPVEDIGLHLLDAASPLSEPPAAPIALEPASDDPYVGDYAITPQFVITITRTGSRYFLQATGQMKAEVFPKSPSLFFLKIVDAQVSFADRQDGHFRALTLHQNGVDQTGPRVDAAAAVAAAKPPAAFALPPETGARYVGRYELAPGFILSLTREGTRYFAQVTGQPSAEIFPASAESFRYRVVDAQITFTVNATGSVTGLILHQNGDHPGKRLP